MIRLRAIKARRKLFARDVVERQFKTQNLLARGKLLLTFSSIEEKILENGVAKSFAIRTNTRNNVHAFRIQDGCVGATDGLCQRGEVCDEVRLVVSPKRGLPICRRGRRANQKRGELFNGGCYCGQEEEGCQEVGQEEGEEVEEEVASPRSVAGARCRSFDTTRKSHGDRSAGPHGSSVF